MERILIIKLGAIGDVVHSLPVLSTLRSARPEAEIAWAVEEAAAPVLDGNPDLNERILLERKKLRGSAGAAYFVRWLRDLRSRSFDAVIDLHNLLKSGIIARASGAPIRIGFRKWREGNFLFMNRRVRPDSSHRHAVEKYLSLLGPLGIGEDRWKRTFPLQWDPADEEAVRSFLARSGIGAGDLLVAVNPGANWESKRWMPDRFAAAADELIRRSDARIVVTWGPGEKPLAETVIGAMKNKAHAAPSLTLKQLMALIRRSDLLISGDTGPAHLAAALGRPTVTLFGPSDPDRNGPYGEGHAIVRSAVPPATHWERKEWGDRWMKAIPVEQVIEAAVKQLRM